MKCRFVVGQHVVCIKDKWLSKVIGAEPKKGDICKITGMTAEKLDDGEGGGLVSAISGVWLELDGYTSLFCSGSFRALQQRPTKADISVFKHLLNPTRVPEVTQ